MARTEAETPEPLAIGIQGETGSFNEVAILAYLGGVGAQDYELRYLSTTERVLAEVMAESVQQGQFAVHNSTGGVVAESRDALAKHDADQFTTIAEYDIEIAHALMIHPDAAYEGITTLMTHPQVLAQCRTTVAERHSHLAQTVGEGVLIDPATVAKQLGSNQLSREIAVMGNPALAEINGLVVADTDLQDSSENYTTFRLVKK